MNVRSNLITLARGFLCFFVFEIVVGFFWVGSALNIAQYFIWTAIGIIFLYSIIVTSPSYSKNYHRKTVVFLGFSLFFALFLLDKFQIMTGADYKVLIFMCAPFAVLHYLIDLKRSM